MSLFRLTQISDSHLSRRYPTFAKNFHRVSEHIDTTRPDLVVNSGDLGFDGPEHQDDLEFAKAEHDALPWAAVISQAITTSATTPLWSTRLRRSRHRRPTDRLFCRFSARTAGVLTQPDGVSSA